MKRTFVRICLLLGVVGLLAGCGGSGDDKDSSYNFGGRWLASFALSTASTSGFPESGPDILLVSQDGTSITVKVESMGDELVMQGTCDPGAKTFSATGNLTSGSTTVRSDITGVGIDKDSMSGTWTLSATGVFVKYTWTAELSTRTLTISSPGGGARTGNGVLRALAN